MKDEDFEGFKDAMIEMLEGKDVGQAERVIMAAILLSEGIDMTFDVFEDRKEALQAIFSAINRVGQKYGVNFAALDLDKENVH